MDKYRSRKQPNIAGVETVLAALKVHKAGEVTDFFRLHSDIENYWTPELCFVHVPIKGIKRDVLHLIDSNT